MRFGKKKRMFLCCVADFLFFNFKFKILTRLFNKVYLKKHVYKFCFDFNLRDIL